jgi:concentrative nucleoside transporter, CNT family
MAGNDALLRLNSAFGIVAFLGLCWLLSSARSKIRWRPVITGIALQFIFALFILKTPWGRAVFDTVAKAATGLLGYAQVGARFVFGNWPNSLKAYDGITGEPWVVGFNLAVLVLPTLIFVGALFAIGYHLGILQRLVDVMARLMLRLMGVSGAEATAAAANVFLGMTEAPMLVAPFIRNMTRSELFAVMTSGLATIAGSVLVAYIGMGIDPVHLLCASVMNAPASLAVAKLLEPEIGLPETLGVVAKVESGVTDRNVLDAAARGASQGMHIAIEVAAMLIAFLGLIALVDGLLQWATGLIGLDLTLEKLFSWVAYPVAFLLGVPEADRSNVAALVGLKTAANEFIAYARLSGMIKADQISDRGALITTYALCGFANLGSVGILLGGLGGMVPERRGELAALGLRAILAGSIACFLTACIAGVLL